MSTFTPSEPLLREADPFLADPYSFYAWGRQHSPLLVDSEEAPDAGAGMQRTYRRVRGLFPRQRGLWFVFSHEQCVEISRDSDHWTMAPRDGRAETDPSTGEPLPPVTGLLSSDPPEHTRLRSLVAQAFTPKTVERLEPRIRQVAGELLDEVASRGEADLFEAFSYPLPVIVIAELLGLPSADRADFKRWSDEAIIYIELGGRGGRARYPLGGRAFPALRDYFKPIVAARRRAPKDDLISDLVRAEVEGATLTEDELIYLLILILVAGNETTRDLIGNSLLDLLAHPAQLALVREDPGLLPGAVEEVLRFSAPAQHMPRRARRDTVVGGRQIAAGDEAILWFGAANRDEAVFSNPDVFDVRRPNAARHLTFGVGTHFCLGAPLARLEGRVALEQLLARLPNLRRAGDGPLPRMPSLQHRGVRTLPLRWDA